MAFRGINCKTSVKVDDTLALQKSFKIDYLLFILDPTSPVCWLWSWPVCGWGWDLSVQGRSGGGRGQTQLLSGKQMCILWKFLLLCGIQVTNFFWLFLKMTFSIIIIIFDFNSSFCSFSDIELEKELYEDMKEENYELSERN